MDSTWNFAPTAKTYSGSIFGGLPASADELCGDMPIARFAGCMAASAHAERHSLPENFKRVTHADMPLIWQYLREERGRTTDFSYGGLLMWVDYFKYRYAVVADTLFIKGVVESDRSCPAFSVPVGKLPLAESVRMLKEFCARKGYPLEFSAVPEYMLSEFERLGPVRIEQLEDWSDYLYSAEKLATLSGKKYGKKRNHVNRFETDCPGWMLEAITPANVAEASRFMDLYDTQRDDSEMAVSESMLTRQLLGYVKDGDPNILGGLLRADDGRVVAFTLGDIKGDTLFVHVEKADREVAGSYEMINKAFAESVVASHPEVAFINREDASGDEGLRRAKESYHPVELLRKYNILF